MFGSEGWEKPELVGKSTAFGVVGLRVVGVGWVSVSGSGRVGREGQWDRHGWAWHGCDGAGWPVDGEDEEAQSRGPPGWKYPYHFKINDINIKKKIKSRQFYF
jgi:hypothetical protein